MKRMERYANIIRLSTGPNIAFKAICLTVPWTEDTAFHEKPK